MNENLFLYMRAWLRLQCAAYHPGWTDEEVHHSFALLPMPAVDFITWQELALGEYEQPATQGFDGLDSNQILFDLGVVEKGA